MAKQEKPKSEPPDGCQLEKYNAEQCVNLAGQLVLLRREKFLRNKGRKRTPRSDKQYLRGPFRDDIMIALQRALSEAGSIAAATEPPGTSTSDERASLYQLTGVLLRAELRQEIRGKRRKQKGIGLISSVMHKPVTRRGRPCLVSPDEEQRWVDGLWGIATALWADREGLLPGSSLESVIVVLTQQPDWKKELERLFPAAVSDPHMRDINPPAKNQKALIERARAARKVYAIPRKLKSGG